MISNNCNEKSNNQFHDVKLDFSDVLLLPNISEYTSRKETSIYTNFYNKNKHIVLTCIPIAAANMHGVGTFSMAKELSLKSGCLTFLHKHYTEDEYIKFFLENNHYNRVFYTLGSNEQDFIKLVNISKRCKISSVCLDVANGYMKIIPDLIKKCKDLLPDSILCAGNIVTTDVLETYAKAGADFAKIGIGSGALCLTRAKTGVGYPQFSSILDMKSCAKDLGINLISDGGCTCPGDICKAFVAGADIVMLGGMFAGHAESETEIFEDDVGHKRMMVYGMSSKQAMLKTHGNVSSYKTPEGKVHHIEYKGHVSETLQDICGGLRSFMTYTDIKNLNEACKKVRYIRVNNQLNKVFN